MATKVRVVRTETLEFDLDEFNKFVEDAREDYELCKNFPYGHSEHNLDFDIDNLDYETYGNLYGEICFESFLLKDELNFTTEYIPYEPSSL